jgi:hypothetical protein
VNLSANTVTAIPCGAVKGRGVSTLVGNHA